jgi:ribose transport system permease protein
MLESGSKERSAAETADVPEPDGDTADRRRRGGVSWRRALSFSNISLVYVGIALFITFALWTPDTFLTSTTAQLIAQQQVATALVAVGLVIPLAAGVFDLSVGYAVGLSAMLTAYMVGVQETSLVEAILIALASGLVLGCVNGFLVVVVGIDSFIATLASGSVGAAAILGISDNSQIIFSNATLTDMGNGKLAGIPIPVFYLLVVAVILWFALQYTPWGRRLYAVGGSRDTARLAGVNVNRVIFASLLVSAVCGALAGVVVTANIGAGSPDIGPSYLLPAFAAVFLGSTQLKNGRFNVWGTVLAVYVLGIGIKGLQLVSGATWVPDLFNGIALATAVGLAVVGARHQALLARLRRRRRGGATPRGLSAEGPTA